jgi:hypothetical protein
MVRVNFPPPFAHFANAKLFKHL